MRLALLVESEDSICSAVETLKASRSDCALARRGCDYGILIRTNLLEAVALSDHSLDDPVGAIATWNLITINEVEFLFDALIKMTRHGEAWPFSRTPPIRDYCSFVTSATSTTDGIDSKLPPTAR